MGSIVDLWSLQPGCCGMFRHLLHSVPCPLFEATQICHLVSRELLHRPLFSLPIAVTRPHYCEAVLIV